MPRFGFAMEDSQNGPTTPSVGEMRGTSQQRLVSSVRLSCLSPDNHSMHSLARSSAGFCIETHRLPLDKEADEKETLPLLIRTRLPDILQAVLEIDAAVELICVEGESMPRNKMTERRQKLPYLCLYTRKSAYLLQLAYTPIENQDAGLVGEVISITEPFERQLLDVSFSTCILRIRPAPQRFNGYSTLCPTTCMAMLTENTDIHEYTLYLLQADGSVTVPLQSRFEQTIEQDRIIDFCFSHSNGLPLFSSLSVLLLKESGDVSAASPIVFEGTVLPRAMLEEGLQYLQSEKESLDRSDPKWKQCRAAEQYLLDTFPVEDRQGQFATARLQKASATWPVKLQGPVLFNSAAEPGPPSRVIESFGNSDMVGFAIGKEKGHIDFAMLSPTALLPRIDFESLNDTYDLDDALYKLSALVERVSLGSKTAQHGTNESLSLVKDPVVDTLLHFATSSSVFTISTNVMRIKSRELQGHPVEQVRTSAWSCLSSGNTALQGIIVASDAHLGHQLIARLENGSMVPVNVSESQCLHEMNVIFEGASERQNQLLTKSSATTPDQALHAMESSPPLYQDVEPLVKKISSGLAGMGRIVGSETKYEDITPDTLAVAMAVKTRCDEEVVLPLLELKKLVETRRESLKSTIESQLDQMEVVQQTIADLNERMAKIGAKMEAVESNAATLMQRSENALQASHDLLPKMTQAEYEYIEDMKRLAAKCDAWEEKATKLKAEVAEQNKTLDEASFRATVDEMGSMPDYVNNTNAVLKGQEESLRKSRERLNAAGELTKDSARASGLESENVSSNLP